MFDFDKFLPSALLMPPASLNDKSQALTKKSAVQDKNSLFIEKALNGITLKVFSPRKHKTPKLER